MGYVLFLCLLLAGASGLGLGLAHLPAEWKDERASDSVFQVQMQPKPGISMFG